MKSFESQKDRGFNPANPDDFTKLYHEFQPALFLFAKSLLNNEEQASDICAEVFIRLFKMGAKFTNKNSVKAFLFISVRNSCFNYLRDTRSREARQKEIPIDLEEEYTQVINTNQIHGEVLKHIYAEIDKLPRKSKQIFILSILQGLSTEEVSKRLGISRQSVRNAKTRALHAIRSEVLKKISTLYGVVHYFMHWF